MMKTRLAAFQFWRTSAGQVTLSLLTFMLVCVAWVFFRAPSLSQAVAMLADMVNVRDVWTRIAAGPSGVTAVGEGIRLGGTDYLIAFAGTALLLVLHWQLRNASLETAFQRIPATFRVGTLAIMLYLVLISMVGEDHAFIYFQF
jgi:hypothetical protein